MTPLFANEAEGIHPPSWYAATATAPAAAPALDGDLSAEVAVVGAGFTGLSAALALALAGREVVLLDAHRIGWGASGRNGGQVLSGQRQSQSWLEARFGDTAARAYWDIAEAAKREVRRLVAAHAPEADWQDGDAYFVRTPAARRKAEAEARHMARRYGYDRIETLDRAAVRDISGSDAFAGGLIDWGAGHIHPLRLAFGMARAAQTAGTRLFERTTVRRIDSAAGRPVLATGRGRVEAGQVILATNGYGTDLAPALRERIVPINNYIVVTEPLGQRADSLLRRGIAAADDRFVVNYWRMVEGGRLLFGGGESYGLRFPPDIARRVRRAIATIYPDLIDAAISHAWGGTLGITATRLPVFRRIAPGVLGAAGYSGQGVALATLGGRIMAEAILGDPARFDRMRALDVPKLPGGAAMRGPLATLAMQFYALRDRIGV